MPCRRSSISARAQLIRSEFHFIDAIGIVDEPGAIAGGERLGFELEQLLDAVACDVARAGDDGGLAFQFIAGGVQHLAHEVDCAVAGRFFAADAAAEVDAFAGHGSGEGVCEPAILADEVADLARADADVSGGLVRVGTDGVAKLDAPGAVGADVAIVVDPADAVRFGQTFEQPFSLVVGVVLDKGQDIAGDFSNRGMKVSRSV